MSFPVFRESGAGTNPHQSSGNPVFMRVKTNPPPFTMRLCLTFVNRKTEICSVFGAFFQDFAQFHRFSSDFSVRRAPARDQKGAAAFSARLAAKAHSGRLREGLRAGSGGRSDLQSLS